MHLSGTCTFDSRLIRSNFFGKSFIYMLLSSSSNRSNDDDVLSLEEATAMIFDVTKIVVGYILDTGQLAASDGNYISAAVLA